MNKQLFSQPILGIDLKKNRIRIHKLTLQMLGYPDYIQLLVNPTAHTIAIRKSFSGDHLAHRVKHTRITEGNCYELYSTHLLQAMRSVTSNWENKCSYRIYGKFNSKSCVAVFSMEDIILVDNIPQILEKAGINGQF